LRGKQPLWQRPREAIFANLRHDRQEYPFYPLNPDFRDTPVAKWWLQRTRALREALGKDELIVSKRLMVVEWFPYHSSNFDAAKHTCESQAYSQDLVKQLCLDRKLIIGLRGQKHWDKVVPGIPYLRSWQSSYLTPRNMTPDIFQDVLDKLRSA
jgi:hypothetical protein